MRFKTKKLILLVLFCGFLILSQSVGIPAQSSDINAKDETGLTALMQEAQDGTSKQINQLLKKGADTEIKDQYGWTALMYAVFLAEEAIFMNPELDFLEDVRIRALLDGKANVNASDPRGYTPLMIAADRGKTEIVKLLLSKGAVINEKDKKGATALSYAKAKGHNETVKLLVQMGGVGVELDKQQAPVKLSPIDIMPKALNSNKLRAGYTQQARTKEISGNVRFRVLIGADGTVKRWILISGLPYGLTEQCEKSLKKLKASPGIHEGKPVDYWTAVSFSFAIG